jgi:hypothetical protein
VVASQQEKVFRVLDFIGQHEGDALDGLFSSIDVVSEEEVVLVARVAAVLEQFYQV